MELFKTDGTLKKRSALMAHYNEYLVGLAKQAYEADMKAQHSSLFPETVEVVEIVDTIEVTKQVPNPNYVNYDEWMAETMIVTPAVKEVVDKVTGMVTTPAKDAVISLVREFKAPIAVGDLELDAYLKARYSEIREAEYDPIGEQIDRITKTFAYLKDNGVDIGIYGIEQVDASLAVKAKYPK